MVDRFEVDVIEPHQEMVVMPGTNDVLAGSWESKRGGISKPSHLGAGQALDHVHEVKPKASVKIVGEDFHS
jgi:hypothetical protein